MSRRPLCLTAFLMLLGLLFSKKAHSADDFPYGCKVFYSGAERVFTDYSSTDGTQSRHYSTLTNYIIGGNSCEVTISASTPYPGGCTVDGVTTGQNVTITAVVDCPIDHNLFILFITSVILGAYIIRQNTRNFLWPSKFIRTVE